MKWLTLIVALLLVPAPARAHTMICMEGDRLIEIMATHPNLERVVGGGVLGKSDAPTWTGELWLSDGGKSWSFVVFNVNGTACLMSAGKDWEHFGSGQRATEEVP